MTKRLHAIEDTYTQGHIDSAVQFFARETVRLSNQITFEVYDYSRWDELYEHMPAIPSDWANINLTPNANRGALKRETALIHDGRVIGRFPPRAPHETQITPNPTIRDQALLALATSDSGLAIADSAILLFASDHIVRTDLSGPAHGTLLACRMVDDDIMSHLTPIGWKLSLSVVSSTLVDHEWTPSLSQNNVVLTKIFTVPGGKISAALQQIENLPSRIQQLILRSTLIAVSLAIVVASLLGILLGWHWVNPIRRLAQACRIRDLDQAPSIPECAELSETFELSNALRRLTERDWETRRELTLAHEKIRSSLTIHRRFSTQLSHELTFPLHTLSGLVNNLARGHSCVAADVINAQTALSLIEKRLTDNALLAERFNAKPHEDTALVHVHSWMTTITDGLKLSAEKKYILLNIETDLDTSHINVHFLFPIMIHLLSNAIKASPVNSIIRFCCSENTNSTRFSIIDQGPGFTPDKLPIIRSACARGVVLPGEPGIGFGLSLVIERCAELNCSVLIPRSDSSGTEIVVLLKKLT